MTITDSFRTAISTCVAESVYPERIILFGSHARGEAQTDSDVAQRIHPASHVHRFHGILPVRGI
ncbi:nucleotidyltransferase domain-containing protein [Candidatus Magnetaquicoccus inordinatus]|uniref:nucleotidyltransferase domain-containing protein n=1 Tax=Candidatus Magnetaquicoccus inordinatus TaxID=2496818 RepID=UPI00102C39A8|nr:nucleotidyltransferase domain-containing protein [Candidatus Magnetaquicoccus inordinatus]